MYVPPSAVAPKLKLFEEWLAKRTVGKALADMEIVANASVIVAKDVKAALDKMRPAIEL